MALWSGRFEKGVSEFTQEFGASLPVDKAMYHQDIAGSRAHARMLAAQGVISEKDAEDIVAGLADIEKTIEEGNFTFDINDEDIHMSVEKVLTQNIGDAGARLHTGRSRNDQVITDTRLYAKELASELMADVNAMRETLIEAARKNMGTILPGYTHMQHAQPVLLSHHFMAYYWMFTRDFARLKQAFDAANANPLGSAALAGTTYPLDRQKTTDELGFDHMIPNSLDAVSDRDFLLDLDYACSVAMIHLSRLSEEIILWSTSEFGFITLADEYSTGSSIMPQKKNPDFAELIRGKSGRVYGNLVQLLVTMKGLPLAYNKDLQEDKEGALDTAHTLMQCLSVMAGMISTWTVNEDAMARECGVGHVAATDVADYLAKRGLPFREAHAVVGHLVLMCEKRSCNLEDLPFEVFQEASPLFEHDITEALDIPSIVAARTTEGGTAPAAVAVQLQRAEAQLVADEGVFGSLTKVVEMGHGAK